MYNWCRVEAEADEQTATQGSAPSGVRSQKYLQVLRNSAKTTKWPGEVSGDEGWSGHLQLKVLSCTFLKRKKV